MHAGDSIYQVGKEFGSLYVVNSGLVKMVNLSSEGREQVVALHFRGDWLGLDGIASGHYGCDAIAMDTGEVWSFRYEDLLQAALRTPALLSALHQAMSRQLARDHPGRYVTVVISELVERHWYHYLLHNQRAEVLTALLMLDGDERISVVNVPWYLKS